MREYNIKNIAKIVTGRSFRRKVEHTDIGNIFVVMAQDLKKCFYLTDTTDLTKIEHSIHTDKFIEKGNVLLSSKGYFTATVSNIDENMIGASSIYILKVNREIVFPEFVALWLNSNQGQSQIGRSTSGAMIKTITKNELENIKLKIPSLEKQKLLIDLYKTKEDLNNKLGMKMKKIENIFQGTLSKIINS